MAYNVMETCMLVSMGLTRSECASWVQAWGSIGAILMAVWGVQRAHRLQQDAKAHEQAEDYTRFLETLFQLLGGARGVSVKIIKLESIGEGSTPDERGSMLAELTALSDAFKRVDLNRFDRYDYIEAWLVGDGCTRKLISAVEWANHANARQFLDRTYLRTTAESALAILEERGKRLFESLEERGGPPGAPALPKDWTRRPKADH